jgi:outer membrane protein assembly factor BamB
MTREDNGRPRLRLSPPEARHAYMPGLARMQRKATVAGAVLALLVVAAPAPSADWPRYGGDDLVTNDVPPERAAGLSPSTAGGLTERWSADIGGRFVASPLYAANVDFGGGGVENVVYAATNSGTVSALRAGDGTVLWTRQVSGTVQTCDQTYGISSTPVLDRSRNRLYVAGADGLLFALDLATGATVAGWPLRVVDLTGTEYVWGGLALAGDRLYVPVASYCDKPDQNGYPADGRLVAVDVDSATVAAAFDVVPGPNDMGGIWAYGGVSIDPLTGHLWATTGNSWVYERECDCILESAGYAESVVELDQSLNVVAWNRPEGIPQVEDNDFGATPLLFEPPGCPPMAAANAKNGRVYAWLRGNLGGGPVWTVRAGPDTLDTAFVGQPSYSTDLNMLYVSDARDYDVEGAIRTFDAVVAFALGPGCTLPETPTWVAPSIGRGPKSPPLVVGDLLFVPGGFDRDVFALDARSGATIWSATLPGAALSPISFADGLVLVGDSTGVLHAFGLPTPTPTRGPGSRNFIPL